MRQQALANEDPSASAWLTASPTWPNNRMNDIAFRRAFQLRNLIPVVRENGVTVKVKWTLLHRTYFCMSESGYQKQSSEYYASKSVKR